LCVPACRCLSSVAHLYNSVVRLFFLNDTAATEIYTLSLPTLFRSFGRRQVVMGRGFVIIFVSRRNRCWHARTCGNRSDRSACARSEEHTSELQSRENLVCRLLLEKKNTQSTYTHIT